MSGRPTLRIFQFDLDDLEVAARSVKQGLTRNESRHGDIKIFMAVARKLAREETYGDFDIVGPLFLKCCSAPCHPTRAA